MEQQKIKKCCICSRQFVGWGNNPWPVVKDEDAVCCDDCNSRYVLVARLNQMFGDKENG